MFRKLEHHLTHVDLVEDNKTQYIHFKQYYLMYLSKK